MPAGAPVCLSRAQTTGRGGTPPRPLPGPAINQRHPAPPASRRHILPISVGPPAAHLPLAARQAETAHPAGPGDSNRQETAPLAPRPWHLAAALTLRLVSSRGFGGCVSGRASLSRANFFFLFSQCFSSSPSLVADSMNPSCFPTPRPPALRLCSCRPAVLPSRDLPGGGSARMAPGSPRQTVRIAQSEIALSGHRVGHRARPRLSRGRDARKQGVLQNQPEPGGEQKPTRKSAGAARGPNPGGTGGDWGILQKEFPLQARRVDGQRDRE